MRKYPPKGHATGQSTEYAGFGQSRGLPVAFCRLRAKIRYTYIILCHGADDYDMGMQGTLQWGLHEGGC